MNNNKSSTIEEVFKLAVKNHQQNKLGVAQDLYNKILKVNPDHSQALNNLANIFEDLGENQKATNCYEKAIEINPNYVDAHYNLGNIFRKLGQIQKAKDCFEKAIEIDPSYVKAHNNLGIIFKDLGENQKAKECFKKTIELNPNYADAHNNLGNIFKSLGENQKAKECFEKAIEINPNYIDAHANLTNLHIGTLDDLEKPINLSYKTLKIFHKNFKFIDQSISLNRLKHDVSQAKYISQTGAFWKFFKSKKYKVNGIDEFQIVGSKILSRSENKEDNDKKIILTPQEVSALLPFYKSECIYKPKIISGSCINANKNWQKVEDEYFNSEKQIIFIDDFLSDEALIELREFCLISKVWNREYNNKYLGAFSNSGFISPIHLQIAIELKKELPKLFGPHKIEKFWGFKYDTTLGKGINIHADFAVHNLNFWITPDEFNNNKNTGGLKVYDTPSPENWPFETYNNDKKKIYKFLEDNNAKCTNIPYKFNRAVLFNSAYFHETDEIDFKDKYEGRRINMTYLFGSRNIRI